MKSALRPETSSGSTGLTIPARIIIGVAGPQKLEAKPGLIDAIRTAVEKITQMAPPLQHTQLVLSVLSTLTEDSDLLVAEEILKIRNFQFLAYCKKFMSSKRSLQKCFQLDFLIFYEQLLLTHKE